jgi:ornithine carbamoyltransferase
MKKDFLSIDDITRNEINEVMDLAEELKKNPVQNMLNGKIFCLLFEKPSTRTRVSFDSGIQQLGGGTLYLDATTSQISRGETVEDTARVLDRYVNVIIARVFSHKTLEIMSKNADANVINALSDLEHPCQILADLFTIREKFGYFEGVKLAYVGDGNNVCNSLLLGCAKVGMDISVATPKGYEPDKKIVNMAINYSKVTNSKIVVTKEPKEAVKGANVVYNDTFISMGNEKEKKKRLKAFLPKYQVNKKLLEHAKSDVLYMHCLPAHRGEEVTSDVIDGNRSIIFDQAENRMHVQKALILRMIGKTCV